MRRIQLVLSLVTLCAALTVAPAVSAQGDVIPGELIVAFRSDVPEEERTQILTTAGADQWEQVGLRLRLKLVETDDVERALAQLRSDPRVEYAERNYRVAAVETTPNDPEFSKLWGLRNTGADGGTADADIDADEAWDTSTGSASVVVAVIDTGIDFGHPDLSAAQWTNPGESGGGKESNGLDDDGNGYVDDWRGWDFVNDDNNPLDDHGHGTHVAGTIGAAGNDGAGVVGVNWQVKLMALKFLSAGGWGTTADAVEAIRYATAMGAVVTNNSWGGGDFSQALLDAIEEAGDAGSLFVAAAGNDGEDADVVPHYPSSYEAFNIVSVAATDRTDARASFSNFGARSVDLGAPGAQIYSTIPGGGYATFSGTSMATPHVAGAAALAKAAFPGATAYGLKALLLRTVDPVASMDGIVAAEGRLNIGRAADCAGSPQLWVESPAEGFEAAGSEPVEVAILAGACGAPAGVQVTATVAGSPVPLATEGDGLYTGSFVPPAEGGATLTVTATAGATSEVLSVSGEADTTPPSIALTAPADGLVVRGVVTLAADAADGGGMERVEFLVDGAVVGTDASAPYALAWDSATGADATRSVSARAVDVAGNATVSAVRSIRVENAPPVATPAAPSGGGGGGPAADLALTGYAAPTEVAVGSSVTLFLRVLDDKTYGPADDVVVEIDLPSGLTLLSSYSDRGPGCGEAAGGKLRCRLDWLSAGAPYAHVTLAARATAPGEILVGARVEYAGVDPNPIDNAVVMRILVPELKTDEAAPAPVEAGRLERAALVGRELRLRLVAERPTTARIVVSRRGRAVLSARRNLRSGETVLRLTLPRRLRAGSYRVVVTLGDGTKLAALVRAR